MKQVGNRATLLVTFVLASATVGADDQSAQVFAAPEPRQEVPAVSSPARGRFTAEIHHHNSSVEYTLSFRNLQASVVQAHIHFAQPNVNGGIMVWLCGTAGAPGPTGTQPCPQEGTITGVITETNVLAVTSQGIAAGEFEEFVRVLLSGFAYVNVHTTQSPGGEIRGQVRPVRR